MRSLLLALDDTPAAMGALEFALFLATRYDATITGVSVLDVDWLTAPEPGRIGSAYYKFKIDLAHLKQAHQRNTRLVEAFLERCKTQNIKGEVVALEGSPAEQLCRMAATHDVIVMGRDSDLRGEPSVGLAETVERILQNNPRPLIVTPAAIREPSRVLIAYDGSIPAARALQILTLLGFAANSETHIVCISPQQDEADRWVREACTYVGLYGSTGSPHPIASTADPAELVMAEAKSLGADLLMMGAYGHRGWREALLGSCTTRLLAQFPAPLFIHH